MKKFDPKNSEHNIIVQERLNKMMHCKLMVKWINESHLFGKDKIFTDAVIKYIMDEALKYYYQKDFDDKIKFNTMRWIKNLDIAISRVIKKN